MLHTIFSAHHLGFHFVLDQKTRVILIRVKEHIYSGLIYIVHTGIVTLFLGHGILLVRGSLHRRLTFNKRPHQYLDQKHVPHGIRVLLTVEIAKYCFCGEVGALSEGGCSILIHGSPVDVLLANGVNKLVVGSMKKKLFIYWDVFGSESFL